MTNTYIQDKLDELDYRFAIIIDEKINDKVYKNIDYGDFYGKRDELKDFIKEIFVDYHNHIVEIIDNISPLNSNNAIDHHIKIKSLLQDTNLTNS